jgi:hypothetical protein
VIFDGGFGLGSIDEEGIECRRRRDTSVAGDDNSKEKLHFSYLFVIFCIVRQNYTLNIDNIKIQYNFNKKYMKNGKIRHKHERKLKYSVQRNKFQIICLLEALRWPPV